VPSHSRCVFSRIGNVEVSSAFPESFAERQLSTSFDMDTRQAVASIQFGGKQALFSDLMSGNHDVALPMDRAGSHCQDTVHDIQMCSNAKVHCTEFAPLKSSRNIKNPRNDDCSLDDSRENRQ